MIFIDKFLLFIILFACIKADSINAFKLTIFLVSKVGCFLVFLIFNNFFELLKILF